MSDAEPAAHAVALSHHTTDVTAIDTVTETPAEQSDQADQTELGDGDTDQHAAAGAVDQRGAAAGREHDPAGQGEQCDRHHPGDGRRGRAAA